MMENPKSELLESNAKRQKVKTNDVHNQTLSNTFAHHEAMEIDKLERERNHLTNLNVFFPELVWEAVLKNIDKNDDIQNISNSCPYFRNLLAKPREEKVLLPNVFAILAHHFEFEEDFKDIKFDFTWPRKSSEKITFDFPKNDFIKCRLACKSWNNAIEEIHQNKDAGHYIMNVDFKTSKNNFLLIRSDFDEDSKVRKFINHFEATHYDVVSAKSKKCPFLWRYVWMEPCENPEYVDALYTALMELIKKWGEEIWYFKFETTSFEDYVETVAPYQKLKQLCSLMPNLRVLKIVFDDEKNFEFESPEELQDLIDEISINPFPKLAKLEYLSTAGVPIPVFSHIIDQHQQITQLNVERQEFAENFTIFSKGLPNLTQLSIEVCSKEEFEMFERSSFQLKLKKMCFVYHDFENSKMLWEKDADHSVPFISWSRVLAALEKKIDSTLCTELYLKLPTPNTDTERESALQDSLHYRLKFQNVQLITIWQATVLSLDFLLTLKNSLCGIKLIRGQNYLKDRLSFSESCVQKNHFREMQVIQFLGFEDNMQESNISSVLPCLKTVVVSSPDIWTYIMYFYERDGVRKKSYTN